MTDPPLVTPVQPGEEPEPRYRISVARDQIKTITDFVHLLIS